MRLKSILLHGFKSFHTRTEVPLGEGITAIVGPNGCGKSNVSDALRWVLGEGNVRNIRGESLLDVVFKGAGETKPAGFAEVSLRIDNEDRTLPEQETDVSVARRVYRSGDSDFLINNLPCRLKDIRNLFLGTGLGSQGYSVIERGMVDAVLSDRDDQRRLFFEEAAGISRYKVQRKEAMRKLEATEQDLLRIDDLVQEIEREVRRLARQVGKARKHKRLHDQIRDLEVALALCRWDDLMRQHAAAASERDHGTGDRERLQGELVRAEAEQETRKSHLLEKERLLEETRAERERVLAEQSATREVVSSRTSTIQAGESRIEELTRRIDEEGARAVALRRQAEEREPDRERFVREIEEHATLVGQAESDFEEAERRFREARAEAARTAQIQMEHVLTRTKEAQELESLDASLGQIETRREELASHGERLEAKVDALSARIESGTEEVGGLSARLEEFETRRDDLETAREIAEGERERLRTRREDVSRARASRTSRLELLREQEARHEGFDAAVRYLLDSGDEIPGIVGVVGELVTAGPDLTPAAAEAVLADAVQWVVVRDEAAAYEAIERLRAKELGGVTFFPLAEMAVRLSQAGGGWPDPPPVSGPETIAPLIRFLLERVRPAESRQQARETAASGTARRAMTPEGELHSTEGWVRWPGLSGADRAILDRIQEIPLLEERCAELETEEAGVASQLSGYEEELVELRGSLASLVLEAKEIGERHRRREREVSEAEVERDLLLEERERAAAELRIQDEKLQETRSGRDALARRLGISGETEKEAEGRHRAAQREEETTAKLRDETLERLSGRRTEAVRLENGLHEVESAIAREREEADRLDEAIRRWTEERDEADRICADARA
ncbi:MAG: AAA family ATPase, partial [Candidatus Eisenbacteria bacterium]|nr:AAA family ATPase [Candidatus Latescibacterota bacterium]MBD3303061.1 AAA family ATPase [Candidatus Eisenbacteria bacterium]